MSTDTEQYILPIGELKEGDIILIRYDDDRSRTIRKRTNSNYSHAALYVGSCSYLEAGDIIEASNLQRLLLKDPTDAIVLRLKEQYNQPFLIRRIIIHARQMVGTAYSWHEAYGILDTRYQGEKGNPNQPNRQTCTRFVSQVFHDCGLDLVHNYAYCAPRELELSDKLENTGIIAIKASKQQQELALSESILTYQTEVTESLLKRSREIAGGEDIQTMDQLTQYVLAHPDVETEICNAITESGYLSLHKLYHEQNPWDYDRSAFDTHYKGHELVAATEIIESSLYNQYRYRYNLLGLMLHPLSRKSAYIQLFVELYLRLLKECDSRIEMAQEVLNGYGLSYDLNED